MAMQGFTDNYDDDSTEAGFQYTFKCDICGEGYQTRFIESKTYKKGSFLKTMGGLIGTASDLLGTDIGSHIERGTDVLGEKFSEMSPEWRREHDAAFELAQNEAKEHFHRCPKCTKWVCENDWNEQEGLCAVCAPRVSVEVGAAKAQKAVQDIQEKAAKTQVFTGEIESKQTLCPQCGKPAGEGKFCNNCGASLALVKCQKCGAQNPPGTRFCGECGNRLE